MSHNKDHYFFIDFDYPAVILKTIHAGFQLVLKLINQVINQPIIKLIKLFDHLLSVSFFCNLVTHLTPYSFYGLIIKLNDSIAVTYRKLLPSRKLPFIGVTELAKKRKSPKM